MLETSFSSKSIFRYGWISMSNHIGSLFFEMMKPFPSTYHYYYHWNHSSAISMHILPLKNFYPGHQISGILLILQYIYI